MKNKLFVDSNKHVRKNTINLKTVQTKTFMTRREYITLITKAGLLTIIPFGNVLTSCVTDEKEQIPTSFFSDNQMLLISSIAESILPKSDTYGALDLGVPHFIDLYVKNCFSRDKQETFLSALNNYSTLLIKKNIDYKQTSKTLTAQLISDEKGEDEEQKKFVKAMKELTLKGYFSTEKAINQHFNYNMTPGVYKGCETPEPNQKPWIN